MCTAITFQTTDHYFGRTLDLEYHFEEKVTITPRNFPFHFTDDTVNQKHHAIIGMATVVDGFPLYYEAINEKGLAAAGLSFPHRAQYFPQEKSKKNVSPFELIPRLLAECGHIEEAKTFLSGLNITDIPFSSQLPLSPLHWIVSDKSGSLTVETTKEGLKIFQNPIGVLTNSPGFDYHLDYLSTFMHLSSKPAQGLLSPDLELKSFSRGSGAVGLPGDSSSPSRFVRASFNKLNSLLPESEKESVNQFFHILSSVEQVKGTVKADDGKDVYTIYTSCCNTEKGIYYYTTYNNRKITAVDMHTAKLDSNELICFELQADKDSFL